MLPRAGGSCVFVQCFGVNESIALDVPSSAPYETGVTPCVQADRLWHAGHGSHDGDDPPRTLPSPRHVSWVPSRTGVEGKASIPHLVTATGSHADLQLTFLPSPSVAP